MKPHLAWRDWRHEIRRRSSADASLKKNKASSSNSIPKRTRPWRPRPNRIPWSTWVSWMRQPCRDCTCTIFNPSSTVFAPTTIFSLVNLTQAEEPYWDTYLWADYETILASGAAETRTPSALKQTKFKSTSLPTNGRQNCCPDTPSTADATYRAVTSREDGYFLPWRPTCPDIVIPKNPSAPTKPLTVTKIPAVSTKPSFTDARK